jgi:hypothetical protein
MNMIEVVKASFKLNKILKKKISSIFTPKFLDPRALSLVTRQSRTKLVWFATPEPLGAANHQSHQHGWSGVPSDTRRRRSPVRRRGCGAGGEAGVDPGRPARRGGR